MNGTVLTWMGGRPPHHAHSYSVIPKNTRRTSNTIFDIPNISSIALCSIVSTSSNLLPQGFFKFMELKVVRVMPVE
jgi:hypothetical protein